MVAELEAYRSYDGETFREGITTMSRGKSSGHCCYTVPYTFSQGMILRCQQCNCWRIKILHIKIQTHLKRVRAVAHGEVFGLALVVHPLLEHFLAEDAALGEEGVILLER
jgi:hypothetical protein